MNILLETDGDTGAFRVRDGQTVLAELTYRHEAPNTVTADRTFVDPSLRGQGVAGKLLDAAVEHARNAGWTIVPRCSYVASAREKREDIRDVVAPG